MSTHQETREAFAQTKVDALTGLRPMLLPDREVLSCVKLLDGCFTRIQQAIGTHRRHEAGSAFLERVVEKAKFTGLIDELIQRHDIRGVRSASLSSSNK